MKPDDSRPLRMSPALAGFISALAGMVSCGVVSDVVGLDAAVLWPGPVAGVVIGYLAYQAMVRIPLRGALREFGRDENAPVYRGGFPWRAALTAWLVAIVACGAFSLAVAAMLTAHDRGNVPFLDVGLSVGLIFGFPIALGVLLLGHRRRELVVPEQPTESTTSAPDDPHAADVELTTPVLVSPTRPPRSRSAEKAAVIGVLVGMYSCAAAVQRLEWYAPLVGIVVALVVFKWAARSFAADESISSLGSEIVQNPVAEYSAPITGARLPWGFAGVAWIACAAVGGLYAYWYRVLAADPLPFIQAGLRNGGLLGIPVSLGILYMGRRRRRARPLAL